MTLRERFHYAVRGLTIGLLFAALAERTHGDLCYLNIAMSIGSIVIATGEFLLWAYYCGNADRS